MFAKRDVYFVLMTLAAAIVVASTMSLMTSITVSTKMPSLSEGYVALSLLLLPFGAALWIAPDYKTTLEGACLGLIVGLIFVVYVVTLDTKIETVAMRQYFILHRHIIEVGFIAFWFVIMSTFWGFCAGYGLFLFGRSRENSRRKARLKRLRR